MRPQPSELQRACAFFPPFIYFDTRRKIGSFFYGQINI